MLFIGDITTSSGSNRRLICQANGARLLHNNYPSTRRRQARWLRQLLLMVTVSIALSLGARADSVDGVFVISQADTYSLEDVLLLNATISYGLSEGAIEALNNGVPLTFETQIELDRVRRYLPDPNIVQLVQRMQLSFHALTQRFVVKNLNSSEQWTYGTLSEALVQLGRLEALPIIDLALLDSRSQYTIAVRSVLDTKAYAAPLRMLAALFRVDDWRLESPWRRWPVRL